MLLQLKKFIKLAWARTDQYLKLKTIPMGDIDLFSNQSKGNMPKEAFA